MTRPPRFLFLLALIIPMSFAGCEAFDAIDPDTGDPVAAQRADAVKQSADGINTSLPPGPWTPVLGVVSIVAGTVAAVARRRQRQSEDTAADIVESVDAVLNALSQEQREKAKSLLSAKQDRATKAAVAKFKATV